MWHFSERISVVKRRMTVCVCVCVREGGCIDRDSSASVMIRYWLNGPGIESRWGWDFSAPVQTGWGAHPAFCTVGTGTFQGLKRPGRGVKHPPHLAPKLKEEKSYTFLYLSGYIDWIVPLGIAKIGGNMQGQILSETFLRLRRILS